ncbi:MAG: 8-oxo-dGTP diphosphatase [Actinomycetota bacterium]
MEGGVEEEPAQLDDVIRAAGGVVWRDGVKGREVLLVHRPKYDDWSFPKGKADDGEDDLACALREVEEETGLRCLPEGEVGCTFYRDGKGRRKVVRYWAMRPAGTNGDAQRGPDDPLEVDELAWLPVADAAARLSYRHDREILRDWNGD